MIASGTGNGVLFGLSDTRDDALTRALRPVRFDRDEVLQEPGLAVETLWFPTHGLVALLTVVPGCAPTATGWVGRDGAIGLEAIPDVPAMQRAVVQMAGEGFAMDAAHGRELAAQDPAFARRLSRGALQMLSLATHAVACERLHAAGQKIAAWLLLAHDNVGDTTLRVTHQQLASLLSLRRSTVTVLVDQMRAAGSVTYTRGNVQVLDAELLARQACTCMRHGVARAAAPAQPRNRLGRSASGDTARASVSGDTARASVS